MILNKKKVNIFENFLKDEDLKITASHIAKKQNFNQKSVYLFLEELEKENILKSEFQGKNKLYSLKKENKETLKHFLILIEHFRTILFYEKHPGLKIVLQKLIQYVKGTVIIFGSFAKGREKKDSDLDIFILGEYDKKNVQKIIDTFNIEINIKHQKEFSKNSLTREIKENHILIKNFEKYFEEAYSWIN